MREHPIALALVDFIRKPGEEQLVFFHGWSSLLA